MHRKTQFFKVFQDCHSLLGDGQERMSHVKNFWIKLIVRLPSFIKYYVNVTYERINCICGSK